MYMDVKIYKSIYTYKTISIIVVACKKNFLNVSQNRKKNYLSINKSLTFPHMYECE